MAQSPASNPNFIGSNPNGKTKGQAVTSDNYVIKRVTGRCKRFRWVVSQGLRSGGCKIRG